MSESSASEGAAPEENGPATERRRWLALGAAFAWSAVRDVRKLRRKGSR